jgi:hypothetical protein
MRRHMNRHAYAAYLASVDWKLTRSYRIDLAGGKCERCHSTQHIQAHHVTYARVRHEFPEDLEVLCRDCHHDEHRIAAKERPMPASNANVTTAAITPRTAHVSIRVLAVNNNSMTLAVYRQLPQRPLINTDGTVNGTPWGTVSLCPSRDCPAPPAARDVQEHRHILWEAGGQLHRDTPRPPERFYLQSDWPTAWATLAAADRTIPWDNSHGYRYYSVEFTEGLPAVVCYTPDDDEFRAAMGGIGDNPTPPPCECKPDPFDGATYHRSCGVTWRKGQALLEARAAKVTETIDTVADYIRRDLHDQYQVHAAQLARWEEVKALPQLFLGTSPA